MTDTCTICGGSGVTTIEGSYFRGSKVELPCPCQDHRNSIRLGDQCSPMVKRAMERFWKRCDELDGNKGASVDQR